MNKYEQLIEHIINDETDKARELFHNIVVEKSRDIYESLIDEQDLEEVGGNEVEDLVDEITIDEQGISEEEDEEGAEEAPALDALDSEEGEEAPEMDGEEHEEAEIEDRVVDLEAALDELKAEFDALMAGEAGEEHHAELEAPAEELPEVGMGMMESEDEVEESKEEDSEMVREYVEKAPAATTSEEGGVNKSSTVAGKNDMGGTASNIATGKANTAPDGTSPKGAVKSKGFLPHAGSYENVPGAKAGNAFAKKESAVKKEEGAVNKTTPLAK
jgi:uncharacterized coiled-coil DUF342 family protein